MLAPGRDGEGAPDYRGNASRRDRTAGGASMPAPWRNLIWIAGVRRESGRAWAKEVPEAD
jgi:hypothetical protein